MTLRRNGRRTRGAVGVVLAVASVFLGVGGCSTPEENLSPTDCSGEIALPFRPDVTLGGEAQLCFGFDARVVGAASLEAIAWTTAPASAVSLHHALLFASRDSIADGPCDAMPSGSTMVTAWARGAAPLALPADMGLALPNGTTRLVVQAHVLRSAPGDAETDSVRLCTRAPDAPERAAYAAVGASVPALRPHHVESTRATCRVDRATTVIRVWPHMHRIGRTIQVALGAATAVDVAAWNVDEQRLYSVEAALHAGDVITIACTWFNPTDDYVFPGPKTTDEMCNAALIVSPPAAVACDSR